MKEVEEMSVDGVFVLVGETPNSKYALEAGIKGDERRYIVVDSNQQTNIPGVYAAGDVTSCPVKQIGTAVGQAVLAATEAFLYVKKPYYYSSIHRQRTKRHEMTRNAPQGHY